MTYLDQSDLPSLRAAKDPAAPIRDVFRDVSDATGFSLSILLGNCRTRPVVRARDLGCWVAHRRLGISMSDIGKWLGSHHTTIMAAVRREDARRAEA